MNKLKKSEHYEEALELFNSIEHATEVARIICTKYNIPFSDTEGRKVRGWLKPSINLPLRKGNYTPKILIYDIETSQAVFKRFWTGKQFVGTRDVIKEPQIITIAFKWLGSDEVIALKWKNKSDKKLIKKFLKYYNKADMIVGINNDNFDNRWISARAAKYNLDVNRNVKSFDIQKKAKSEFRLLGYSMSYLCDYFDIPVGKYNHSGIGMWNNIEDLPEKSKEYKESMAEMIRYNKEDVCRTEDLYLRLRKYFNQVTHLGVIKGESKATCVECGGLNLKLINTVVTSAGTIQRIMKCKDDGVTFKWSNRTYLNFVNNVK